jgi:hypothetical protein
MREVTAAHEKEMDVLIARLRQKQAEVYSADERISDLKHQLMVGQTAYQTERLAMKNSLSTVHQLKISQQNALIYDCRAKIDVARQQLKSVKVVSLDSYSGHFEGLQREIDDIVAARKCQVEEAAKARRAEFEQTLGECQERLKELDAQIAISAQRSQMNLTILGNELQTCVGTLETKNHAEVSALKEESKRLSHYLGKVQVEWDCLRESTQRIYNHRLTELEHDLQQTDLECEFHLRRLADEHRPIPDTIDYMAILRDDLNDMEMGFRVDEANLEHNKMLILNGKLEEEHERGMFQALRQNAEEVATVKQTEEDLKVKLEKALEEAAVLDAELHIEIERYREDLALKRNEKVSGFEQELSGQRAVLREELRGIMKQIENFNQICAAECADLEQLRIRINTPEDAAALAKKEEQLHAEFNRQSAILKDAIGKLSEEVDGLRSQFEAVKQSEVSEKERLVVTTQKFNSTRDSFVKSVDRTRKEIGYKFKRLIETERLNYEKMEVGWAKEQQDYENWIQQRKEEVEHLKENRKKKSAQLQQETKRQLMELRRQKSVDYLRAENALRAKLKPESDALRAALNDERAEWAKQRKHQVHDNQAQQAHDDETYRNERMKLQAEIADLKKHIADAQKEIVARVTWKCAECEKLEGEEKTMKKEILSIVEQMHESQKEEVNRQFVLDHIGKSTRQLPRLKTPTAPEIAHVV